MEKEILILEGISEELATEMKNAMALQIDDVQYIRKDVAVQWASDYAKEREQAKSQPPTDQLQQADVSGRSELLVNFLWEQYEINKIIRKKDYMLMVANARKINQ